MLDVSPRLSFAPLVSAQLYAASEEIEAGSRGEVHFFFAIGGSMETISEKIQMVKLPFLFPSIDVAYKVLEEGASTLSKEESGKLALRQQKFIKHLEAALIRIENKSYGICRETGKLIPKERLMAVPHATLSIEAKEGQSR